MRRMHYAMTSGIGSRIFCPAAKAMLAARRRIIDCSSKRFYTDIALAFHGVIFPSVSEIGNCLPALWPVGEERSFRAHFQDVGERSRQRIHDDRCHHCARSPA